MRIFGSFAWVLVLCACQGGPGAAPVVSGGGEPVSAPISNPAPAPAPPPTPSPSLLDSEEQAFVTLINDYRAQNGAPKLLVSIALTQSSKWMSTDMATKDYFSHTDSLGRDPFTRMAAFGYASANAMGENIAAGNAAAQDTFTQWKNSPAHNANMLDSAYLAMGVGRAYDASSTYGWYWTTDFGSTVDAVIQNF